MHRVPSGLRPLISKDCPHRRFRNDAMGMRIGVWVDKHGRITPPMTVLLVELGLTSEFESVQEFSLGVHNKAFQSLKKFRQCDRLASPTQCDYDHP
jgi:hypothetical protein